MKQRAIEVPREYKYLSPAEKRERLRKDPDLNMLDLRKRRLKGKRAAVDTVCHISSNVKMGWFK